MVEDRAEEQCRSPLGLSEAGHEQAAEGDEPWTLLTGRHAQRQHTAGGTPAAADEPMSLVLGDEGLDLGEFPDLVSDRLGGRPR